MSRGTFPGRSRSRAGAPGRSRSRGRDSPDPWGIGAGRTSPVGGSGCGGASWGGQAEGRPGVGGRGWKRGFDHSVVLARRRDPPDKT